MKRVLVPFSLMMLLIAGGCKKDLLDINDNPNSATFSTPQLTMPVALEGAARVAQQSYISSLGIWMGYYATPSGFSKPAETYTYDISNTYLATVWDNLYNNIADLDYVEKGAIQMNLPVYQAIAKVMKVYDYHQLVDLWGNVPYSEALQGSNNFTPKYDDGKVIYDSLIKQLDAAIDIFKRPATAGTISLATDYQRITMFNTYLNPAAPAIPTFISKWIKFTNTLKLKLLMNQSQISGIDSYIKGELNGLTTSDFLVLGEDATENPGYSNTTGKLNPVFGLFYSTPTTATDTYKSVKASDYGVKAYLNTFDSSRIAFYYDKPVAAATYIGTVFGDPAGPANVASIGKGIINSTAPGIIMLGTESLFLQSEAVQRGYIMGDAKQLYLNAVNASFVYDGSTALRAMAYTSQANSATNWDSVTVANKIQLIITQKWFALNGIDILAVYNDYRRTGFPNVPLSIDAGSKGKVPTRLIYPQRESLLNSANVVAQGTINPIVSTVFWDK